MINNKLNKISHIFCVLLQIFNTFNEIIKIGWIFEV